MSNKPVKIVIAIVAGALVALLVGSRPWRRDEPVPQPDVQRDARTGAIPGRTGEVELAKVRGRFSQRGVARRRIAGRVMLTGKPYPNAQVTLRWTATHAEATPPPKVTTDAAGRFDLGMWFAERYTVTAAGDGTTTAAAVTIDLRDPTLSPAPDALELTLTLCSHTLFGSVFDGSGGPIVGALVSREDSVGATTGADGMYSVCLPSGKQVIYVAAEGYGRLVLTVEISGRVRRDVLLVPSGTITGQIIRKRDRTPITGALVSAWPVDDGPDRAAEVMTHSDDNGRFQLKDLVPGRFTVWASNGLSQGSAVVFVAAGARADVTLAAADRARIAGRVMVQDKPLAGATVYARAFDRAEGSPPGITQLDGSFALDEVPFGEVAFVVSGHAVVAPTKTKIDREDMTGIVVSVAPMATISGVVLDNGAPAAGATVFSMNQRVQAFTNIEGGFRIAGLAAGSYDLQAELAGIGASAAQTITVVRGEQLSGIVFDLANRGSIEGTVVDQNGASVKNAVVTWLDAAIGTAHRAKTDDLGWFKVDKLKAATYRPSVRSQPADRMMPLTGGGADIVINDAQTHIEGIRLQVKVELLSISGRVVDTADAAVADARIDVLGAPRDGASVFYSWLRLPSTVTADDGSFTITGLADGAYAVRARGADGSEAIAGQVAAGATNVVLQLRAASKIEITLVGFAATPAVDAQSSRGDFKNYYASVSGMRAVLDGIPAGKYIVAAHSSDELDAAMVEVAPGVTARITLTSRGSAQLTGKVTNFVGGAPVADMMCLLFPRVGGVISGVPVWEMGVAPRSNGQGEFHVDPAPAGQSAVYCYNPDAGMSSARAFLGLERGQSTTVALTTVHQEAPGTGDIGIDLDQGYPLVVNGVRDDGPAAIAGVRTGDQLAALSEHNVDALSKGGALTWIANQKIGAKITITMRRGTETLVLPIVIGLAPAQL